MAQLDIADINISAALPLPLASIAGFINDDMTRSALLPVLQERGWGAEDSIKIDTVNNAINTIAREGCPQMLIVDLSDSTDPRADIGALAEVCEPGTLVLALGDTNDVSLYRDLIQAGVQDYLLKPLAHQDLADAMDMMIANFAAMQQPIADLSPDAKRTIAVIGVRGGIGASSLVANLGYGLATAERPAVILDLDLNFGTTAMQFDLEPGRGLVDGLENPARVDGLFLDRALVRPTEHLAILAAEAPIGGYQPVVDGASTQMLEALRENFATIVIDLPRSALTARADTIDTATDIVVVTDFSISAARDCIRILGHVRAVNPDARVHIVLCQHTMNDQEVSQADFVNSIESSIVAEIPDEPKAFLQASQKAQTVLETLPNSRTAQAYKKLIEMLQYQDGDLSAEKKSWLKKLFKG